MDRETAAARDKVLGQDIAKRDILARRLDHITLLAVGADAVIKTVHERTNRTAGSLAPHQIDRVDQVGQTVADITVAMLREMQG